MTFTQFKKDFQANFAKVLASTIHKDIYKLDVNKVDVWSTYINEFTNPAFKQEQTCNCCKSFLYHYGALAVIGNNFSVVNFWDFKTVPEFQANVDAIKNLLNNKSILSKFYSDTTNLGTDKSFNTPWEHLYLKLDRTFKTTRSSDIGTKLNESNTAFSVFKRALEELTPSACEIVLDLIADNNLYRGEEHKVKVNEFYILQNIYLNNLSPHQRDSFIWVNSNKLAVSHIRNSAIGTLLVDLSKEDADTEKAIKAYERVVAPSNYQRPKAIATAKQLNDAKAELDRLGFTDSIHRRTARPEDLNINNVLYKDRAVNKDIFADLTDDLSIDVTKLKNIKDITLDEFITQILPVANNVHILLENKHVGNMFTLLTAVHPESPTLMKWDNQFSWSYNGGVADSIAMRVKNAGGKIDGRIRISLAWETTSDLDLSVEEKIEYKYHTIYYANKSYPSPLTGGQLDVDAQVSGNDIHPVENIYYPADKPMKDGTYIIRVKNFLNRKITDQFTVEVEFDGRLFTYNHQEVIINKETITIGTFTVKNNVITYDGKEGIAVSNDLWGLKTNRYQKVNAVFLSPNYWGANAVGNKHLFFYIENALNDGVINPFFNEQLTPNLTGKYKRVFELLASKLEVEKTNPQVSGIGISSTIHTDFIIKVNNQLYKVTT
jgi:transposase